MGQWIIPPAMRPQAVVFDMDGLMVDTERVIKYTWDVTGERMGYKNFGDNILHTLGKNRDQRNEYFRKTYGENFPLQDFLDGYHQVYAQYEKEHGIPKKKGLMELLKTLRKMERRNTTPQMAMMTAASLPLKASRLCCRGVLRCWVRFISAAMWPISVSMPVPVTTLRPRP